MRFLCGMGNRIKIGVGGRFHADQLANALLQKGWEVSVVTSLPKSRFKGVPPDTIESALFPEILFRIAMRWNTGWASDLKMKSFGRAFSRACDRDKNPAVLLAWSGFAVEAFRNHPQSFKVLVRDSLHILDQVEILEKEYRALGIPFHDHRKVIERELEEYRLANKIVVISNVAKESFLNRGVPNEKLAIVRLGASLDVFRSNERQKTMREILEVVYFGTIGVRKGVVYLLKAFENLASERIRLTCIGSIEPELKGISQKYPQVRFEKPLPHKDLAKRLRDFDVFVMPSLEDGFGLVVPQAMAAGLVPVVSKAVGASELISDGKNGVLIQPKDSEAIVRVLKGFLNDPNRLDNMRTNVVKDKTSLSWDYYGDDFDSILRAGTNIGIR